MLIFGALLTVAGIEIAFHWLLHRGEFPALLAIYLDRGNSGKAFNAGIVDNLAPAAFVGWISGWIGYPRWSPAALAGGAGGLAVFVAALVPVYRILIGPEHFATVWGAPKSFGQEVSFHAYDVFTAFLAGGAFTHGLGNVPNPERRVVTTKYLVADKNNSVAAQPNLRNGERSEHRL